VREWKHGNAAHGEERRMSAGVKAKRQRVSMHPEKYLLADLLLRKMNRRISRITSSKQKTAGE